MKDIQDGEKYNFRIKSFSLGLIFNISKTKRY